MPNVSEEELEALRKNNLKLREGIAAAQSSEAENLANRQREYEALTLLTENTRLEGELARAKEAAKVGASREGAATLMEQAALQLEAAKAVAEQPAGPVDTNAEVQPKSTTGVTTPPSTPPSTPSSSTSSSNGGN